MSSAGASSKSERKPCDSYYFLHCQIQLRVMNVTFFISESLELLSVSARVLIHSLSQRNCRWDPNLAIINFGRGFTPTYAYKHLLHLNTGYFYFWYDIWHTYILTLFHYFNAECCLQQALIICHMSTVFFFLYYTKWSIHRGNKKRTDQGARPVD